MRRHLLRTAMALGIAALAFSFTVPVRAQDATTTPPPKPEKAKRQAFTGLIESVDAKAGTVIVKKGTESKTFKLGDKTKYSTADKKEAALADIKVGDKVKVGYTEENGVATAHRIGPPDVPKKTE
jgi:Cu/Ag efflux protein CusF